MSLTASRFEQKRKNIVIASQCSHWRGNPPVLPEDDCPLVGAAIGRQRFPKSLPLGEGARGTRADEGNLPLPMGEVPPGRGRRGFYLPSQSLRDSSPRVGAKGLRIATPVCAISWYDCHWQSWIFQIRCAEHHWFAMTRIYKSTSKIYPHPLWNVENLSVDNFTVKIFSTRPVEGCEETHTGLWKKSGCRSKAKWTFPHKLSLILLILP